jgi:hypothetical protein
MAISAADVDVFPMEELPPTNDLNPPSDQPKVK